MKRRTFIKSTRLLAHSRCFPPGFLPQMLPSQIRWKRCFVDAPLQPVPPPWWHWMNSNVTADGIARDLEAMSRVGVGGVRCSMWAQAFQKVRSDAQR